MAKKDEKVIEAEVVEKDSKVEEEKEKAYFFPRAIAYFIDIILVAFITTGILLCIPTNKNYDKYVKEYKEVQQQFMDKEITLEQYMDESVSIVYDVDYSNCAGMIIQVTVLVLYFVVFQAYNKGQTIGKKIMKIKLISTDGNDLNINQIAIRALIINSILVNLLIIGALLFSGRNVYYYISLGLQGFEGLLVIVTLIMVLFRNDGKGLHDLLAKTQVVSNG